MTALAASVSLAAASPTAENPSAADLCRAGAPIGEIRVRRVNVFDTSIPEEDRRFFRFVNVLHSPMKTREGVVRALLTVAPGEPCRLENLEESARRLRAQSFLQDAWVRAVGVTAGGEVVVEVWTQDTWSTRVSASLSNEGGESTTKFYLRENNFLGTGNRLSWERRKDQDRTERTLQYEAPTLLGTPWRAALEYSENSDGSVELIQIERPFYRLDERWALSTSWISDERRENVYACKDPLEPVCADPPELDRYMARRDEWSARAGFAPSGLVGDRLDRIWIGARGVRERWDLSEADDVVERPDLRPQDRNQSFVSVELVRQRIDFRVFSYINSARRVEDIDLGDTLSVRLDLAPAWSGRESGAELFVRARRSFVLGDANFLVAEAGLDARRLDARSRGTIARGSLRWLHKPHPLQSVVLDAEVLWSEGLPGNERILVGGERGARAYASRSFAGSQALVLTGEHRVFAPWYIARLVRLGLVGFAEVAAVWEEGQSLDTARVHPGIGVGLRAQILRSADGTTVHFNAALPLDPDAGDENDGVRFSVLTAVGF